MKQDPATDASEQNRLRKFARAFKNYMGLMPIVTAALAPLLTFLRALPTYESQRGVLATLSGILGFLLLAWIFYVRRTVALGSLTRGFRSVINLLPMLLVFGTLTCFLLYFYYLDRSTAYAMEQVKSDHDPHLAEGQPTTNFKTRSDVLKHWDDRPIPHLYRLDLFYLGIFLFPECAFVLMALREYINDVLGISEIEWMFARQDAAWLDGVQERALSSQRRGTG